MNVVRKILELTKLDGSVGFVPTMGALHEGHLSLIRESKRCCSRTVVSVFVNPLQFGPAEDLAKYPRPESKDIELAESAGADVIFIPEAAELLDSNLTTIQVSGVSDLFEGERRPGHFEGVATIVCKLFNLVRPTTAYFGLKDRQQCVVLRQMVHDLNLPFQLEFLPTIRESDGLALSSRNIYLSKFERAKAPFLYASLQETRNTLGRHSEPDEAFVAETLAQNRDVLSAEMFEVDYLDLVDEASFKPTSKVDANSILIVAAKLGTTRLIDNVSVLPV